MNKKVIIPSVIVGLLLLGGIVYLAISLNQQKQANKDMQELAELDKKEMENEYQMLGAGNVPRRHPQLRAGDRLAEPPEPEPY